jgi:hypothetical protein
VGTVTAVTDTDRSRATDAAAGVADVAGDPLTADGLVVALAAAAGAVAECRVVLRAWHHLGNYSMATEARFGELAARYAVRMARVGRRSLREATRADAAGFVTAPTRRGTPPAVPPAASAPPRECCRASCPAALVTCTSAWSRPTAPGPLCGRGHLRPAEGGRPLGLQMEVVAHRSTRRT